jgi:hypothetical protein
MSLYKQPLCIKCLHPINYHSETIASVSNKTEIRQCTIGICLCIIHLEVISVNDN